MAKDFSFRFYLYYSPFQWRTVIFDAWRGIACVCVYDRHRPGSFSTFALFANWRPFADDTSLPLPTREMIISALAGGNNDTGAPGTLAEMRSRSQIANEALTASSSLSLLRHLYSPVSSAVAQHGDTKMQLVIPSVCRDCGRKATARVKAHLI